MSDSYDLPLLYLPLLYLSFVYGLTGEVCMDVLTVLYIYIYIYTHLL